MLSSYRLLLGLCNNPISRANTLKQVTITAECANLRLSASAASGEPQHPWDFVLSAKNSARNNVISENCEILEHLYQLIRTHFISKCSHLLAKNP